jgi:hypothetical protein
MEHIYPVRTECKLSCRAPIDCLTVPWDHKPKRRCMELVKRPKLVWIAMRKCYLLAALWASSVEGTVDGAKQVRRRRLAHFNTFIIFGCCCASLAQPRKDADGRSKAGCLRYRDAGNEDACESRHSRQLSLPSTIFNCERPPPVRDIVVSDSFIILQVWRHGVTGNSVRVNHNC